MPSDGSRRRVRPPARRTLRRGRASGQCGRSRISTTRPSPRSVAPDDAVDLDQRIADRPRTTISRWPTMRSTTTPTAAGAGADDEHVQRCAAAATRAPNTSASRTSGSTPPRYGDDLVVLERRGRRAGSTSITSRTAACGTAKVWSPTCAMIASVIASVSGSSIANRVPLPGAVSSVSVPPSSCDGASARPPCRRRARSRDRLRRGWRSPARRGCRAAPSRVERPVRDGQAQRARARAPPPPRRCRGRRR